MRRTTYALALLSACLFHVRHANGQRIVPAGTGVPTAGGSLGIYSVAEENGSLYIGGRFASLNDNSGFNIQSWDGENAAHLAGAFGTLPQLVRTLVMHDGDLIAGGSESTFNHVARWDGTTWNAMGDGLPGQVHALKVFEGELYAAGAFNGVARWTGNTWAEVGTPFNGIVQRLAEHGGELYAAGSFTMDADNAEDRKGLVRWNGTAWEQVLTGLSGAVTGLLSHPQGLIIGGTFISDGDEFLDMPNWTIYNGAAFSEEVYSPGAVSNVVAMPDGGFLLATSDVTHRWREGNWSLVPMGNVNFSTLINGQLFIAGQGNSGWLPGQPARGMGYLIDGVRRAQLDPGNIAATLTTGLQLFSGSNTTFSSPGFEAPIGGNVHTIYSATPWLGLRDSTGQLQLFAIDYEPEGERHGPHADVRDLDHHVRYNQVWKLERGQIDSHMAQWDQPGYTMPYAIANWPGNGDISNGEPAVLAPFADLDQNGLYEPGQGDHPLIRGDMAVYVILNATIGTDNKVDIHLMHYAYAAPEDEALNNTVFTQLRVVERSGRDHDELIVALFADFDIGCSANDFAECDPSLDLFFAYNGVPTDSPCSGSLGYADNTPAQGVAFLSSPLRSHRTWNNAELVNPSDAIQGLQNGQPFQYGSGPTNFQFPGPPYTEGELSSMPGDRRSVGATAPTNWNAGEALCYDMAFVFGQRTLVSDPSAIDILKARTAWVRDWYAQQDFGCPANITVAMESAAVTDYTLRLYPNPSSGLVLLQRTEADGPAQVLLRDATGALVLQSTWPAGAPTHQLNAYALADGLYFVEVLDRNGRQQQRLVRTGQ